MVATETSSNGYNKRPLWQWIAMYVVIGAVVYGLLYYLVIAKQGSSYSGYGANQPTSPPVVITTLPTLSPGPASSSSSSEGAQSSSSAAAAPLQISITGSEFAFTPATFTANTGQSVKLTFSNNGQYAHNLSISDLNVATKTIQPGESDTITFTPTKAGTFSYICTVPGHADRGMKGTLTVK